ncbi:MAG TPA: DUF882 domain-containing protein [Polyangiaceae bacterium]|nr:DUF882 domain-containing protein [Polyangiaceae bacterium]
MKLRTRTALTALLAFVAAALCVSPGQAGRRPIRAPREPFASLIPAQPLSDSAWLYSGMTQNRRYRLAPEASLPWLERYVRPAQNHTPDWRRFWYGRYGVTSWRISPALSWAPASGAAEPGVPAVAAARPCPSWQAPRAITVFRYAGESDHFALIDCDGAIANEALDRLSVLARPPEVPRPELPLPVEPLAGDEWLPRVRLLDPRLLWVVQQIADAFPAHALVLMSGYREGGHSGLHQKGRALDLYVRGVPNEALFALCKRLRDVGCGYYPENHFVHVDVRPYATGQVLWIDVSRPGEPSRYVDGWPGVAEPGSVWLG